MNIDIKKHIGSKVKLARKEKGYDQEQFGQLLGLTRVSIINLETGRHSLTLEKFFVMCCILNMQPGMFFPALKKIKLRSKKEKIVKVRIKTTFQSVIK